MAYFLKVSKQQTRTYLSIYESFYDNEKKGTRHRSVKHIGNLDKLIAQGIEDPISYYREEVRKMNEDRKAVINERKKEKGEVKLISEVSPERFLGYFPLSNVLNVLDVKEHFDYMQSTRKFQFNVFDVFSSLVFARAVAPMSKNRTFHDVLPSLFKETNCSYDQLLACVEFVGSEYKKFVEIFTAAVADNYGIDTSTTFFDCTNFYFEIDRESLIQKRGPSKEMKKDPIVGMGLLLDANMIPIAMKIFPGNESEKPVIREVVNDMKRQNNISGRTVSVADKGLNCARNIIDAVNKGDGYLFSKSVPNLSAVEKTWVLNKNGYVEVKDEFGKVIYEMKSCVDDFVYSYKNDNGDTVTRKIKEKRVVTVNYKLRRKKLMEIDRMVEKAKKMSASHAKKNEYGECSRYMNFTDSDGKKAKAVLNNQKIEEDRAIAGYNMLVTSEHNMSDSQIYETYHNLWRIEESFRVMKTDLDARPVYLQKEDSIQGHFLICYVAVLLLRLLQFKVFKGKYSTSKICDFIRNFKVVKIGENKYINITRGSDFITDLALTLNQPITNYYLTDKQIKMMHTR